MELIDQKLKPARVIPLVPLAAKPAKQSTPTRSNLRASVGDGTTFSLMVGLGESFVPAYVLALGLGEVAAGLIVTLPLLVGAVLQLVAPWAVRRLGSYKRFVVLAALAQAASLLALLPAVLLSEWSTIIVFTAATLYWAAGLAAGPAWNTWIEYLVPRPIRANFFARRSRLCHVAVLAGFLLGGTLLGNSTEQTGPLGVFCLLFVLASVARFVSAGFLLRHDETAPDEFAENRLGWGQLAQRLRRHASGKLIAYLFSIQVAIRMAGPFFVPFMLAELRFSYTEFTLLIASAYIGKFVTLPLVARLATRLGARGLLTVSGIGIIPLSALWLVSQSVAYLAALQFVAGAVWGAFELATLLLFFDAIPRHERTSILAFYNLGNAVSMTLGCVLGSVILTSLGHGLFAYMTIFVVSAVARLATLPLLLRIPKMDAPIIVPATRTLTVSPSEGSVERPVYPSVA